MDHTQLAEDLSMELNLINAECHALRQENASLAAAVLELNYGGVYTKPLRSIAAERIGRRFRAAKLVGVVLKEAAKIKLKETKLPRLSVVWK